MVQSPPPYTDDELLLLAAKYVHELLHDGDAQAQLARWTYERYDFAYSDTWTRYIAAWIKRFTDELAPEPRLFEAAIRNGRIRDIEDAIDPREEPSS